MSVETRHWHVSGVKGSSQRTEQLIIVQREDEALAEGKGEKEIPPFITN